MYDIAGGDFPIHRILFKKDFSNLVYGFKNGHFNAENINDKDHRGNTPIILAGKLSPNSDEYLKAVNYLFEKGANGKLRDATGWNLMDEAIS
jgi:ankyrin repeat protein